MHPQDKKNSGENPAQSKIGGEYMRMMMAWKRINKSVSFLAVMNSSWVVLGLSVVRLWRRGVSHVSKISHSFLEKITPYRKVTLIASLVFLTCK